MSLSHQNNYFGVHVHVHELYTLKVVSYILQNIVERLRMKYIYMYTIGSLYRLEMTGNMV